MGITFGDHLIDSGYYDITPEQERELEAREECKRRGIDPDQDCADGGVLAWMVVDKEMRDRRVCDCERGHNGIGLMGRECDCPPPSPAQQLPDIE